MGLEIPKGHITHDDLRQVPVFGAQIYEDPACAGEQRFLEVFERDFAMHRAAGENRGRGMEGANEVERRLCHIGSVLAHQAKKEGQIFLGEKSVIIGVPESGWSIVEGVRRVADNVQYIFSNQGRYRDTTSPPLSHGQLESIPIGWEVVVVDDAIFQARVLRELLAVLRGRPDILVKALVPVVDKYAVRGLNVPVIAAYVPPGGMLAHQTSGTCLDIHCGSRK